MHLAAVAWGFVGILLLLTFSITFAATLIPCTIILGLVVMTWKGFWGPVYRHIYLRHCGWLHVWYLRSRPSGIDLRWCEVQSVRLGEDRVARIFAILNFTDNYCWLIVEEDGESGVACAAVVDPGDAEPVAACIVDISKEVFNGETIDAIAILTTHHHWDHMGGNADLPQKVYAAYAASGPDTDPVPPSAWRVYASALDDVACCTHRCTDREVLRIGDSTHLKFEVIALPCHTEGSVGYLLDGGCGESAVFSAT
eukprot:TRINITY_DN19505_c0_g1_i2.p1 TRINITY_DN19505_c0_g1~~TRINITY_DN19505_c0_g1_i2.p1  ORF type:complete len:262 (+),score=58.64 TRINITY_DN19505_c0_g1_i2:25-786(+)